MDHHTCENGVSCGFTIDVLHERGVLYSEQFWLRNVALDAVFSRLVVINVEDLHTLHGRLLVLLLMWTLFLGELDLNDQGSWKQLARPWMTSAEQRLYDQLSDTERSLFQGQFVARRSENLQTWPQTGLFLPHFHCPKPHGDVRDQILFALGQPGNITPQPIKPKLPAIWHYDRFDLHFEASPGGKVTLSRKSNRDWDAVKQEQIKQPQLLYDFNIKSFGRTRLPEDVTFTRVKVASYFLIPENDGARMRVYIPVPESFRSHMQETNASPIQHMELLISLRRSGQLLEEVPQNMIRHAGTRVDLMRESHIPFEVFLPSGYVEAKLQVYSGYLKQGLEATLALAVKPKELPRVSDPIICQQWRKAGIEKFSRSMLTIGNNHYKPSPAFIEDVPARVLVYSPYEETYVLRQDSEGSEKLKFMERHGSWWVFALPASKQGFRLLSFGQEPGKPIALGSWGNFVPPTGGNATFEQEGHNNYLSFEEMKLNTHDLSLLFVQGQPYLGSQKGTFPWLGLDWGKTANLRFETFSGDHWQSQTFKMRRAGVYEQIQVKPKYLVVGTRHVDGSISQQEVGVQVLGNAVTVTQRTSLKDMPKLWGIVVNDPLLKSQGWQRVKIALRSWLKEQAGPEDQVYLVHNSHRPEMIIAPTTYKMEVLAALESLKPKAPNENYFTVQYLIDALTHLPEHGTRPHQVLLLTNGLTDEVKQMEDLMPKLRGTGLQLYNLEFPFEFDTKTDPMNVRKDRLALETIETLEEKRRRNRENLRDNFQDDRDGVMVGSYTFGKRKEERRRREVRVREQAFVEAFNTQLATLTAGISHTSSASLSDKSMNQLFAELTLWQETLVHMELSVPYLDADMVKLLLPEGYSASWTLVTYRPDN